MWSGPERLQQHPPRLIDAAGGHAGDVAGRGVLSSVRTCSPSSGETAPIERNFPRDLLDLVLVQVAEHRRGALFAEHHQRDGGLAGAADGVVRGWPSALLLSHPAAHDARELLGLFAGELGDALGQHGQAPAVRPGAASSSASI